MSGSIALATEIVAGLISAGVQHVAYCPGSRDAPFAYTLDAAERQGLIDVAIFSEERGAGFWAVGAAKAGETVAVVTTSGTAAAELHPALEEAYFQGLPVIAITADRPHEMRRVGASQTTHQEGIYGTSVVAQESLPAIDSPSEAQAKSIRSRVSRLIGAARGFMGQAGPAHLNVGFRDPLVPDDATFRFTDKHTKTVPAERVFPAWSWVVNEDLRSVVVAGDGAEPAIAAMASARGIPVLAEPTSGVTDCEAWIPYEQQVVGHLGDQIEQIIVTGRPTLSRPIAALLGRQDVRKIVVASHREWTDVAGTAEIVVEGLSDSPHGYSDEWLNAWRSAAALVESKLDLSGLSLLSACHAVWHAEGDSQLWLGASNTIRGFDLVANAPGRSGVFANRGLAGIDGTIASALGFAMATRTPVRAVMGDMTFAYDLTSLAQRPEKVEAEGQEPDIQVIVLDDGGGSIFASLEHGNASPELYERFFAAKPQLDVCAAAEAAGWRARSVESLEDLERELTAPVRGRSVLHVKIPWPAAEIAFIRAC